MAPGRVGRIAAAGAAHAGGGGAGARPNAVRALAALAAAALALAGASAAAGPARSDGGAAVPATDRAWHPPPVWPRPDSLAPGGADAPAGPAGVSGFDRPFEYLWVVRTALLGPADVESVVTRASAMGARGLLVQVVGRGDAYYRSGLLPRSEALAADGFDPLGHLIPLAHAAGLEVHAWVNCMLVWSGPRPPRDPRHVLNAFPEWVARLSDGRRTDALSSSARRRLGIEGAFLAPGHPGVRRWLAGVVREIATRYPVDGIHLDYVRLPVLDAGHDATTRARFAMAHGEDPARFRRLPAAARPAMEARWSAFLADQVTAVVAMVRDTLAVARPGLPLSAAVLADTAAARGKHAQAWGEWLDRGLLDRAFVMCYAPHVQTVLDQLAGFAARPRAAEHIVPGIAVYNTPPSRAAAKIKAARALGFPTLALYSYDSLTARPAYWPRLRDGLAARTAAP